MNRFLFVASLFFAGGLSAQTYFEDDFSGSITDHWTLHDKDGDGYNWSIVNTQNNEDVAQSASYISGLGPITPDNWMVSNAIDLSSATGTVYLTWDVKAQNQGYADENYAVYVNSTNIIDSMQFNGPVFTEIIGATNDEYVYRTVDVSAYVGQIIYIAFRHYNVTNEFKLNIDNVLIKPPIQNDLALTDIDVNNNIIGNKTFSIDVTCLGANLVHSFDLEWSIDGGATTTEHITGINLSYNQKYTVTIPVNGVTEGQKTFSAEITTTDDDLVNNTKNKTFKFYVPVIQFTSTDSNGNPFDLYEHLQNGQAIILDFMASWCGPCETSTPALSQFIENNGSGAGNVQALAITVEANDNASVLNGLNWNGGYYEYPKFPYSPINDNQYYHYTVIHRFNPTGGIPFIVMICPNINDPKMSAIIKYDGGFDTGMISVYQTALDQCPTATAGLIALPNKEFNFILYPNPTSGLVNVDFNLKDENNVTISIINTVGQTVASKNMERVNGAQNIQFNTSNLEAGMYFVKVKTKTGEQTKGISVVK